MKIKVCPACGTKNPLKNLYCEGPDCGESLMNVAITDDTEPASDDAAERKAGKDTGDENTGRPKIFRVCPECGHHAAPNTWVCDACGCKLYGLPLVTGEEDGQSAEERKPNPVDYVLRSEDGRFSIRIREGESVTIGREAAGAEYLSQRLFVGRKHMSIHASDGWIYLTDLSSTNGSLVNGKPVMADRPYKLSENDLISLGAKEGQAPVEQAAYLRLSKAVNEG